MIHGWQAASGLALSLLIVLLGRRTDLVARTGGAALVLSITAVWALRGWPWGISISLAILFAGLAMLYRRPQKASLPGRGHRKPAGLLAIASRLAWPLVLATISALGRADLYPAFVGSLAAGCADIWATELGLLSPNPPRSMVSGRAAAAGQPGAVSPMGNVAAAAVSGLLGFVALAAAAGASASQGIGMPEGSLWLPLATVVGGYGGALVDSILGSTAQAVYQCDACWQQWQEPRLCCGEPARHVRGWTWMTNQVLDTVCSLVGAGATAAIYHLLAMV